MIPVIRNNPLKVLTLISISVITILTLCFTFYKPLHAMAPEIFGMKKIGVNIYIDDLNKSTDAIRLFDESVIELSGSGFKYQNYPKIIFCYYQKSYEKFGFKQSAARSIEGIAIVLSPRSLKQNYFLKHELIHYWQEDALGLLYRLLYPQWIIEGMAYSISNDLRHPLKEPWESYRTKFETWYKSIDKSNLIEELKKIQ